MEGGSVIHAVQGSANRDEKKFVDPDRFDIHRSRKYRHFGFGGVFPQRGDEEFAPVHGG